MNVKNQLRDGLFFQNPVTGQHGLRRVLKHECKESTA